MNQKSLDKGNWKQELTKIVEKNRDDMTGLYDYKQIAESVIKLLRKK